MGFAHAACSVDPNQITTPSQMIEQPTYQPSDYHITTHVKTWADDDAASYTQIAWPADNHPTEKPNDSEIQDHVAGGEEYLSEIYGKEPVINIDTLIYTDEAVEITYMNIVKFAGGVHSLALMVGLVGGIMLQIFVTACKKD